MADSEATDWAVGESLSHASLEKRADELGFSAVGVCRADRVDAEAESVMREYVAAGHHGSMNYLARNMDKRIDPQKLVPGVRSIVSVALNYYPGREVEQQDHSLSLYAYGSDYHVVMKHRLFELFRLISEDAAKAGIDLGGRAFCDTAPVSERYWAWRAGLGFIGKNTLLIIPHKGSYFFLGELFLTSPYDSYDSPLGNKCGRCTRCMDACPGGALYAPFRMDARRCLSYLTIENRDALPPGTAAEMDHCIYGCDRCQMACPHNRFAVPTTIPELQPRPALLAMTRDDWRHLTYEQYLELFRHSTVKRAKYEGLMRNIRAVEERDKDENS